MKRLFLALLFLCFANLSVDAASRFGVCTTTCTWDGASTAMWSATSGGATGASVPVAADTVTFDAATCVGGTTCTITVNTNPTITSFTMGACTASTTGCIVDFSVNNNNITVIGSGSPINASGTGTRNLKMGNGTWTMSNGASSTGLTFELSVITNLTFNANSSTITFADGPGFRSFHGGGLTYNILNYGASMGGAFSTGNNTFNTVNLSPPTTWTIQFTSTVTINNTINWAGTACSQIGFATSSVLSKATINAVAGGTIAWAAVKDTWFTGATVTASNSFDLQNNLGLSFSSGGGACILGG
jgi:hypothetical protein